MNDGILNQGLGTFGNGLLSRYRTWHLHPADGYNREIAKVPGYIGRLAEKMEIDEVGT